MTIKLTKKQLLVLDFLREFTETHDYSPSYREIMAALNLGSVSTVAEHIDNLVAAGVLKKVPSAARSMELIDYKHEETLELFKARLETATEEEKETLLKAAEILDLDTSAILA
jgi:SOS-response transcriptional repressor LexA